MKEEPENEMPLEHLNRESRLELVEGLSSDPQRRKEFQQRLDFENKLMKEAVVLLGKDPDADLASFSNKEKTILVDAMREKGSYSLTYLASELGIALSTYHYEHRVLARPDKYADARRAVREEFEAAGGARGYRYIYQRLQQRGIGVGQKKVRQLMREEGLEGQRG